MINDLDGQVIQLSPSIPSSLVTIGVNNLDFICLFFCKYYSYLFLQNSGQQYAILSQSNQVQTQPQYIQVAPPQVSDVVRDNSHQQQQQQQTNASTKNLQVSNTSSVLQAQQRSATSAHVIKKKLFYFRSMKSMFNFRSQLLLLNYNKF